MDKKQVFGKHYQRLFARSILRSVLAGVALALSVNTVFALLYWMLGFGTAWLGAPVGAVLGVCFGILLYVGRYKMSDEMLARAIDSYGLEERTVTMVELRDDSSAIAQLQRRDAMDKLEKLPEESVKLRMRPALVALVSVAATASVFLGILGGLAASGKIPYGKDLIGNGGGTCEIVYTVEGGGFIRGERTQSVGFGDAGSAVRAVADNGWMFVGWDDGDQSPERSEQGVRTDMQIKARFVRIDHESMDAEDSDSADDLPYGSVIEEGGGANSDEAPLCKGGC